MKFRQYIPALTLAVLFAAGCSIHVKDNDQAGKGDEKSKDVVIKSPFGGLNVQTNDVQAKDTGLSVYPGAREKEKNSDNDNKANVNIDTPWFGVKVVAITYVTDDPQDKVWDFYKKDMAKYGKVLECRPGSPDMNLTGKEKNQLTCRDDGDHHGKVNVEKGETDLRVGTEDHQRVVGFKKTNKGTEFSLVYVVTHGDDKDKV